MALPWEDYQEAQSPAAKGPWEQFAATPAKPAAPLPIVPNSKPQTDYGSRLLGSATGLSAGHSEEKGLGDFFRERFTRKGLESLPIVGSLMGLGDAVQVYQAAKAIEAGTADWHQQKVFDDYIAGQIENQARGTTAAYDIADIVASLPAFAGEFMMTGGGFAAARAATMRTIQAAIAKRLGTRAATSLPARMATQAAGAGAGVAAQQAILPTRTAAAIVERQAPSVQVQVDAEGKPTGYDLKPGESPGEAAYKGAVGEFIEMGSERAGALLGPIGNLIKRPRAAQKLISMLDRMPMSKAARAKLGGLFEKAGIHSPFGESFEERVGDVARDVTGVSDEFSDVTRIVTGVPNQPTGQSGSQVRLEALRDLGAQTAKEVAAFSVPGLAGSAYERVTRPRGEKPRKLPKRLEPVRWAISNPHVGIAELEVLRSSVAQTKMEREDKVYLVDMINARIESLTRAGRPAIAPADTGAPHPAGPGSTPTPPPSGPGGGQPSPTVRQQLGVPVQPFIPVPGQTPASPPAPPSGAALAPQIPAPVQPAQPPAQALAPAAQPPVAPPVQPVATQQPPPVTPAAPAAPQASQKPLPETPPPVRIDPSAPILDRQRRAIFARANELGLPKQVVEQLAGERISQLTVSQASGLLQRMRELTPEQVRALKPRAETPLIDKAESESAGAPEVQTIVEKPRRRPPSYDPEKSLVHAILSLGGINPERVRKAGTEAEWKALPRSLRRQVMRRNSSNSPDDLASQLAGLGYAHIQSENDLLDALNRDPHQGLGAAGSEREFWKGYEQWLRDQEDAQVGEASGKYAASGRAPERREIRTPVGRKYIDGEEYFLMPFPELGRGASAWVRAVNRPSDDRRPPRGFVEESTSGYSSRVSIFPADAQDRARKLYNKGKMYADQALDLPAGNKRRLLMQRAAELREQAAAILNQASTDMPASEYRERVRLLEADQRAILEKYRAENGSLGEIGPIKGNDADRLAVIDTALENLRAGLRARERSEAPRGRVATMRAKGPETGVSEPPRDPLTGNLFGGPATPPKPTGNLFAPKPQPAVPPATAAPVDKAGSKGVKGKHERERERDRVIDRVTNPLSRLGGAVAGFRKHRRSLLGLAIRPYLQKGRWVDVRGEKIQTTEDAVTVARLFRSPQFETFHLVYVKDGKIVAHNAVSSRLPGTSELWKEKSPDQGLHRLTDRARRVDHDAVYFFHNHPSGDTTPSLPDIRSTRGVARKLPKFKGHIIVDHETYSVIDENGDAQKNLYLKNTQPDFDRSPLLPHPGLNIMINDPDAVAAWGRRYAHPDADNDAVTVIYVAKNRVRAIESLPLKDAMDRKEMTAWMRGRSRLYAASDAFLYFRGNPGQTSHDVLVQMMGYVRDGLIIDGIVDDQIRGYRNAFIGMIRRNYGPFGMSHEAVKKRTVVMEGGEQYQGGRLSVKDQVARLTSMDPAGANASSIKVLHAVGNQTRGYREVLDTLKKRTRVSPGWERDYQAAIERMVKSGDLAQTWDRQGYSYLTRRGWPIQDGRDLTEDEIAAIEKGAQAAPPPAAPKPVSWAADANAQAEVDRRARFVRDSIQRVLDGSGTWAEKRKALGLEGTPLSRYPNVPISHKEVEWLYEREMRDTVKQTGLTPTAGIGAPAQKELRPKPKSGSLFGDEEGLSVRENQGNYRPRFAGEPVDNRRNDDVLAKPEVQRIIKRLKEQSKNDRENPFNPRPPPGGSGPLMAPHSNPTYISNAAHTPRPPAATAPIAWEIKYASRAKKKAMQRYDDLSNDIVKRSGIKRGSEEDRMVRDLLDSAYTGLTPEKLRRDLSYRGDKEAAIRAAQRLRDEIFEPIIVEIRDNPEVVDIIGKRGYIRGYFPHMMDELQKKYGKNWQSVARTIMPSRLMSRFLKERTSDFWGSGVSIFDVVPTYIHSTMRTIHDLPAAARAQKKLEALPDGPRRKFAEWYVNNYLGLDEGKYLGVVPKDHPWVELSRWVAQRHYDATIGLNLKTWGVNTLQTVANTIPEIGFKHAYRGIRALATKEGRRKFHDSGLLFDFPGLEEGMTHEGAYRKIMHGGMAAAEYLNRGISYLGGLSEAAEAGLTGNAAEQHAMDVVEKTQFAYGKESAIPTLEALPPDMKVLMTFPLKEAEFFTNLVKDAYQGGRRERAKLARFLLINGGIYGAGTAAGLDLKELIIGLMDMIPGIPRTLQLWDRLKKWLWRVSDGQVKPEDIPMDVLEGLYNAFGPGAAMAKRLRRMAG
jgi:hypothetical protein